mmetsp:Transcript_4464/g.8167  ORF Transcript_4464/g.8167 Transcript_4464/m.8167 type:complete len:96 (+) Transcript_4464:2535-2822(+)
MTATVAEMASASAEAALMLASRTRPPEELEPSFNNVTTSSSLDAVFAKYSTHFSASSGDSSMMSTCLTILFLVIGCQIIYFLDLFLSFLSHVKKD